VHRSKHWRTSVAEQEIAGQVIEVCDGTKCCTQSIAVAD
jgi:hypothetical protein